MSNFRVTAAQTLYNGLQTGNHTRYVAQAESSLAAGRSELAAADSNYLTSRANYRQVIGVELPARLAPGAPVDRLSPRTLDASIARSRSEHPTITTAIYNVDRVPAGEGRGSRALSHPTIPVLALQRGPVMNSFYEDHRDSIHWHYRCFDRILLNGLIQPFQQPERVVGFFNTYRQLYPMTRYTLCDIG